MSYTPLASTFATTKRSMTVSRSSTCTRSGPVSNIKFDMGPDLVYDQLSKAVMSLDMSHIWAVLHMGPDLVHVQLSEAFICIDMSHIKAHLVSHIKAHLAK